MSSKAISAGTEIAAQINPDAVRLMKEIYQIDLERTQHPKSLAELPAIDLLITMGCNVTCPYLPCKRREDWGLADPSGQSDEEMRKTIAIIEQKVRNLKAQLQSGDLSLL